MDLDIFDKTPREAYLEEELRQIRAELDYYRRRDRSDSRLLFSPEEGQSQIMSVKTPQINVLHPDVYSSAATDLTRTLHIKTVFPWKDGRFEHAAYIDPDARGNINFNMRLAAELHKRLMLDMVKWSEKK